MKDNLLLRVSTWIVIAALLLGGAATGGQSKRKKSANAASAGEVVTGAAGAALDAYLSDTERFKDGFSGVALVAKDGEILLKKGYGIADAAAGTPMRGDALFDWCSVSKQFTAAAILRLEMKKKLNIDAPLSKFLKDVPKNKAKVTLRQLMNHTSGIANREEGSFGAAESSDREALMRWFLGGEVKSEPGTNWEYSNSAYFFLAGVIEKVTGKTYERAMHELVFAPAGLKDTWLIGEPKLDLARVPLDDRGKGVKFAYGTVMGWGYRGAGGVVATAEEMLKWDRALRGSKVLSEAAKKKYYEVGQNGYALGWFVSHSSGAEEYSHSGKTGKVVTYYLRWMTPDVVVALACNEEPAVRPDITAKELATIARNAKAP